jgi:hypothetical protein
MEPVSSASFDRTNTRSPGCKSAKWIAVASFRSFEPGGTLSTFASTGTEIFTSGPLSGARVIKLPEIDFMVPRIGGVFGEAALEEPVPWPHACVVKIKADKTQIVTKPQNISLERIRLTLFIPPIIFQSSLTYLESPPGTKPLVGRSPQYADS